MIHPQRLAHAIIVVLLLCLVSAHAQTPAQRSEANKELREKAFALLESTAGQVNVLQSPENRARIAANIMDSLWTHDEQRARSLLPLIESDIREGLNREDPQRFISDTFQVFLKLRSDTIERIAKYDPEQALTFLRSTEITTVQRLPNYIAENDRALELRLAKKIAADKPELALKIARESLSRGFSNDLLVVLRQLHRKHKNEVLALYKEIVSKVKDVNLQDDSSWQNREFIQRLALSFTPPQADAATFRELISFLITKALDAGCRKRDPNDYSISGFCAWVMSSVPPSYKSDSRVAELEHWASMDHGPGPGYFELNLVEQDGSIDEVLALKEKYPELNANISWTAFEMARTSGDLAKAREIAKGAAPEVQQMMLQNLNAVEKATSTNEQLLAELQRQLNEEPNPEERLPMLLSVADLIAPTDRNTALKLLDQASDLAGTFQPGWKQTGGQMGIAMMYCHLKSDRCFQIMEMLVPKFNQLVDSALKLDGFDTQYLRDGEWNMSANGRVGELLTGLATYAGYFAWSDFDRAVSLSNQFERTEIRLMAQVKLAQSVLAGPPGPLFAPYQRYR